MTLKNEKGLFLVNFTELSMDIIIGIVSSKQIRPGQIHRIRKEEVINDKSLLVFKQLEGN